MRHINFSNIRRNPDRKRKVSGRKRQSRFSAITPMGEAIWARDNGLDLKQAKPMKKLRSMYD
jgi:hypothetical protein